MAYNKSTYNLWAQTTNGKASRKAASHKYSKTPKGKAIQYKWTNSRSRWKSWALGVLKIHMGGCVDCGYNKHPAALDFDHLHGFTKRAGVGTMVRRSWGDILEEIAKCEVVCANCHRIRTIGRRNGS